MNQAREVILEIDGHPANIWTDDSHLWLTGELLEAIHHHPENFTHMSVTRVPDRTHGGRHFPHPLGQDGCQAPEEAICFRGALVKITNGEKEWVYRVDDYDMCKDAWHARWPD